MPKVATDDLARRLRYHWLPAGGARFNTIGLFVATTVIVALLAASFSPAGTRLHWLGIALAPGVAFLTTRKVMRHVDHDRPLAWWLAVVRAELDTPRPLPTAPTTRELAPHPGITTQGNRHAAPTFRTNLRRRLPHRR